MTKIAFTAARAKTQSVLAQLGVQNYSFHGPTSDSYWDQKHKIVFINLESIGYDNCGLYSVDYNCLNDWVYKNAIKNSRTAHFSYAMISCLLKCLELNTTATKELLFNLYNNREVIEVAIKNAVYYNVNPFSNPNIPQNIGLINDFSRGSIAPCVKEEILSLDSDIILVSGVHGAQAISNILSINLPFLKLISNGKTVIKSIKHPSRPSYNRMVNEINELLAEKMKVV